MAPASAASTATAAKIGLASSEAVNARMPVVAPADAVPTAVVAAACSPFATVSTSEAMVLASVAAVVSPSTARTLSKASLKSRTKPWKP